MPLFDDLQRTDLRTKREGESSFDYVNRSGRPAMGAFRQLAESWFEKFPASGQADLRGRFRSPNEVNHQSAFFELYLHELLTQLGYQVEVHPPVAGTTNHPDFLVRKDGVAQVYLEATLAGVGSEREQGAAARIGTVYDALNDLESPNFFLELQVRGAPDTPPRTGPLKRELSEWLATLDPDAIGTLYADQKYDEIPQKEWSHEGWSVSFRPMPRSLGCRGTPGIRPVGIVAPEAKWLNTHGDLRDAVERKADKYGALELPLMVAVNVLSMHCDNVDIMNGLFGQETIVVTECADGTLSTEEGGRRPNGAWHGPRGPRKTIVSGVMVVSNLCPWNLGVLTPELFHNPWAQHAIDIEHWALPQCVPDMNRGCFRHRPGLDAPEVLKIPSPWPIPD